MKTKTPPEPSVTKWSLKPADHNAVRVRNNQRRHRARAKSHVLDLEKRLEETNSKLEAALQTISHLANEVEILRGRVSPPSDMLTTMTRPEVACIEAQPPLDPPPYQGATAPQSHTDESPGILDTTAAMIQATETGDNADCSCDGLPPPAPGESTLPCSSAFRIIEQQNFSGVEVTTIRAWLGPGFRKALKPGEACRVETNRVYELLDHITSSS
ncbi:hypothetical protein Daus18300_014325 [Diaporthe australafricana]|uniref:BZIP domain-containing protein n=1 Tax=Diaporthe australafricana TaxID=127596 RepID=A0ABR3VVP8_9PEZI